MPNLEIHKAISKHRTGEDYEKLHKWMDEATAYLGYNHRLERHFYTQEYKNYIEKEWDKKAVVEWLFHIALDNMETASKFAKEAYSKAYEEINICFDKNGEVVKCEFTKVHPNSKGSTIWSKETY